MWVKIKNSKKKKVSIKYLIYEKHHTTLQLVMLCESETTPLTVLFISLFLSVFKYFILYCSSGGRQKNSVCS